MDAVECSPPRRVIACPWRSLARLRERRARDGVLVVAKRDRIARDVVLTAGVERAAARAGALVVSAAGEGNGTAPADAFMRTVIDGAASYERALIRVRTTSALAVVSARGQKPGGSVPYGYTLAADGRTGCRRLTCASLAIRRAGRCSDSGSDLR
jgi:DNA invertase Pin-like site-specific DNA recombinase